MSAWAKDLLTLLICLNVFKDVFWQGTGSFMVGGHDSGQRAGSGPVRRPHRSDPTQLAHRYGLTCSHSRMAY